MYQNEDGIDKVIVYVSRCLSKTEQKYPAQKLKIFALKWAVTHQFHEYLYGNTFAEYMDNNLPTYVLTRTKLGATGHLWVTGLTNYKFAISLILEK